MKVSSTLSSRATRSEAADRCRAAWAGGCLAVAGAVVGPQRCRWAVGFLKAPKTGCGREHVL